jgi:hypothetical protein
VEGLTTAPAVRTECLAYKILRFMGSLRSPSLDVVQKDWRVTLPEQGIGD